MDTLINKVKKKKKKKSRGPEYIKKIRVKIRIRIWGIKYLNIFYQ